MGGAPAQPQVQQNPLNDIFGGGVQQPQLIQAQPPAQSLGGLGDIFGGGSAMGGNPMGGLSMSTPAPVQSYFNAYEDTGLKIEF